MFKNNIPLLLFAPIFLLQSSGAILEDVAEWEKPTLLTEEGKIGGNGTIVVDYYNVQDQCMPMPAYEWVLFNQLAFHLSAQGICEGQGLLLCYPGQLEGDDLTMPGMAIANPFLLTNQRDNEVAKRCEELRKKMANGCGNGDEECPGNVGADGWHGILVGTDKNGDILIRLSTTQRTFLVPRNATGEWLIIKLATAKKTISFLSQQFGPHRDLAQKHDGQEWMEKEGMIHVEEDAHLWKEYAKNIHKGVRMNKYAGIWSLGLDLLPIDGISTINFLVERSKCCEMDAWFLTPTSNKPDRSQPTLGKSHNPNKATVVNEQSNIRITKGTELKFRGHLNEKAEKINFFLSDKSSDLSLNWMIDLNNKTIELLEEWVLPETRSSRHNDSLSVVSLYRSFYINFAFWNDSIDVGVNCKNISYKLDGAINFNNLFSYKFHGDFVLLASAGLPDLKVVEIAEYNGLLVSGTIPQSSEEGISISLNGPIGSEPIPLLIDFNVDLKKNRMTIKNNALESAAISYLNLGEPFEIWIRLAPGKNQMELWVNNVNMQFAIELNGIEREKQKYYLQTSKNIDDANKIITETPPLGSETQYKIFMAGATSETNAVVINGKILPPALGTVEKAEFKLAEIRTNKAKIIFQFSATFYPTGIEPTFIPGEQTASKQLKGKIEKGKDFVLRFYFDRKDDSILIVKINDNLEDRFHLEERVILANRLVVSSVNIRKGPLGDVFDKEEPGHLLIYSITGPDVEI